MDLVINKHNVLPKKCFSVITLMAAYVESTHPII